MRARRLTVTLAALVALLVAGVVQGSAAKVRLVRITSPIATGSNATLTVAVTPASACAITVTYSTGPSRAKGLGRKRAVNGRVSWTWKVGSQTTPGRWPIAVNCGPAGSLRTSFVVRR